MNKTKYLMGVALLIVAFSSSAFAELIDFRATAWQAAAGQQSYTLDGVTVTCNPYNNSSNTDVLFWDAIDGFGVSSDYDNSDPVRQLDEKDDGEQFQIIFDSPTYVYGVQLADLYAEFPPLPRSDEWTDWNGSGDGSGESGGEGGSIYPGVGSIQFWGENSDQANGEQYIPVGMVVSTLEFGNVCTNSEYSIVGVDVVPLPGAALLGVLGLGFAGMRLRRRTT